METTDSNPQRIKVWWEETDTYSVELSLADAIFLVNSARDDMAGLGGTPRDHLPEDATPEQVLAALNDYNDLENQLAEYDDQREFEDGPYRNVGTIELVTAKPVVKEVDGTWVAVGAGRPPQCPTCGSPDPSPRPVGSEVDGCRDSWHEGDPQGDSWTAWTDTVQEDMDGIARGGEQS